MIKQFIYILLVFVILCCSCSKRSYSFIKEHNEIVWNTEVTRNLSDSSHNYQQNYEGLLKDKEQIISKDLVSNFPQRKIFVDKILKKKIHKICSQINNSESIAKSINISNKKSVQSNLNWLWSIFLFMGIILATAIFAKFFGPLVALFSMLAILVILYLILPDSLANAMGQAALILLLNTILQLILSMI